MIDERLARVAYEAYGKATGGVNYQWTRTPTFDDLGDIIQNAWFKAVEAVLADLAGGDSHE